MSKQRVRSARATTSAVLLTVLSLLMLSIQSAEAQDWWPTFHHDSTNSGYSTSTAPANGCRKWCFYRTFTFATPAVVDGKIYIPSILPGDLYCLDAATGEELWNYPTGPALFSSPAVFGGKVYVGSYLGDIYCLDAETGDFIWSYTAGGHAESSPNVAYGRVYIGLGTGDILCLDAEDGDYIWSYPTGGEVISSPAVLNGRVFVGSADGSVYCLDAGDGSYIWDYPTGGGIFSSPAVTDSTVYVGSYDGGIYCLEAEYGSLNWSYVTGDTILSSPAIAHGMVYVGSNSDSIYCLDANDGSLIWGFPTGGDVISSPAIADTVVCVASKDRFVYCLDADNGSIIWSTSTNSDVGASPAIVDGILYIAADGFLYALGSPAINDIAITDITPSRTIICQGDSISIDVTVENQSGGCLSPVSFNCVLYYDDLATPSPAQRETFRSMGDINREGYIDSVDYELMGYAFASMIGDCNWNPDADLNGDFAVNLSDFAILGYNYGSDAWTYFGLGGLAPIDTHHVLNMESDSPPSTIDLNFKWKTTGIELGAHTISAYVSFVQNETDTEDNDSGAVPVTLVSTFTLTVTATEGQTTIPPPGTYVCPCNTDTTFEATPDFWFSYWKLDGDSLGTENPYSVFMGDDHSLHAVFKSPCGDETVPASLALFQNYPNPFNPATSIGFTLPRASHVSLEIFDISGRLVKVLVNKRKEAGRHEVVWAGRDNEGRTVASGIYFCRIIADDFIDTKKMVLLR